MTEFEDIFNDIILGIPDKADSVYVPEIQYKNYVYYNGSEYYKKQYSDSIWGGFEREIMGALTIASDIDKELYRDYIESFIRWYTECHK